jgi:pimeloyl-ACP methyl ester carboxylesterase
MHGASQAGQMKNEARMMATDTRTERFVALATGVRMEYVEQGPRDGVPMIFLHGVTDSWRSFERVLPLLPPSIRAFAISQRGHGESSRPAGGYQFTDFSEDLRAFMDALGLPTAVIVGHSMGSSVAQRFVVDHPERVSALVLAGAFASLANDPGIDYFYATSIAELADPVDPRFAREWQLSTLARHMDDDHLETVIAETLKVPAFVWRAAFAGFLNTPDFTSELAQVVAPSLLMWGDGDTYALRGAQKRLLAAIPGSRLIVYPGFGHALHWEDPARFASDLAAFVATH